MLYLKSIGLYVFGLTFLVLSFLFVLPAFGADSLSIRSDPEDFLPSEQFDDPRYILQKVPKFTVDSRTDEIDIYPCSDCHDPKIQPPNPKVRELEDMHVGIMLVHGDGRFWCLTCHSEKNRDYLISLKNKKISFNESFLLCGQCHFQRQKDFFYGAHGKRKDKWLGEKKITTCTECHNPHVPQIKPRLPVAMPKIRKGLKLIKHKKTKKTSIW